jgi:hypothetical protein
MSLQHFLKFSDRPVKSCDASTMRLLGINSGPPSARTGGKLLQRMATGVVNAAFFEHFLAPFGSPIKKKPFSFGHFTLLHHSYKGKFDFP